MVRSQFSIIVEPDDPPANYVDDSNKGMLVI